jgi:hypothetical protein
VSADEIFASEIGATFAGFADVPEIIELQP